MTHMAIFFVFKPTGLEYIVKGDETDKQLDNLLKRGATLVKEIDPQIKLWDE